jgi:dTDP-4-amino-4,6-dideoxygalactose transaminase
MHAIEDLAQSNGLFVIEDCAQAHGAKLHGKSVGGFGHAGAWSFCQDKILTTAGEGGMVTTRDAELHSVMWSFKDHGKSYEKAHAPTGSTKFRYIHDSIGTNWRLTEIQAAIGRYQLQKLPEWSGERKRNGQYLTETLSGIDGLRVTKPPVEAEHAYYKYYFFVDLKALSNSWSRDRIVSEICSTGTACFTGACPEIYREKAFVDIYGELPRLPVAVELGETSVMVNVHPGISEIHLAKVVDDVRAVMDKAVL